MAVMTWRDVFQVHRKIRAAYVEAGKVKSMLFSQDRRRSRTNYRSGDTLYFCFSKASPEVLQILSHLKVGDTFTVYEKVAPDSWNDLGCHQCMFIGDGMDSLKRQSFIVAVRPS